MSVDIEVVRSVTDELVQAFGWLLPQLSRSAEALDAEALHGLVDWPGNHLLVARVNGEIIGTLTLVTFPIPTGLRAWIEDVVNVYERLGFQVRDSKVYRLAELPAT